MNVAISTRFDVNFRIINIDAISVCFDVILNVAIEKCEHFDDIKSNIETKQNIDFDVAKKIDETNKTNETNEIDFFINLNVTFSVKIRKFEFFDVLNEIDDVIDF